MIINAINGLIAEGVTHAQGLWPREWPAFDDRGGTAWWRERWPRLEGVKFEPHPFARLVNILKAAGAE